MKGLSFQRIAGRRWVGAVVESFTSAVLGLSVGKEIEMLKNVRTRSGSGA